MCVCTRTNELGLCFALIGCDRSGYCVWGKAQAGLVWWRGNTTICANCALRQEHQMMNNTAWLGCFPVDFMSYVKSLLPEAFPNNASSH